MVWDDRNVRRGIMGFLAFLISKFGQRELAEVWVPNHILFVTQSQKCCESYRFFFYPASQDPRGERYFYV